MADTSVLVDHFERAAENRRAIFADLFAADEIDAVEVDARAEFEAMLPEVPYADRPQHTMFGSAFGTIQLLAAFKAARKRGCDVHAFGRAVLAHLPTRGAAPIPAAALGALRKDAEQSQRDAAPNEFVFEILDDDAAEGADWGMNILSCAVCHAYSKHDAMDLVPYMCASDDVVSDAGGQGLQRSGTIGLGAHHCDFRFKAGAEPRRLAEQYPNRIKSVVV